MNIVKYKHDIIGYEDFISSEECKNLIDYFESAEKYWDLICFYNSYGMSLVPDQEILDQSKIDWDFLNKLMDRMKSAVEDAHKREVKKNSIHAQKWVIGAFALDHSDNSDLEGNPSGWRDNKYVAILYLNDDYQGGILKFRDHAIELKPKPGTLVTFPGGFDNIHSVSTLTDGERHTVVSFWDYADAHYSEEELEEINNEIANVRVSQEELKKKWRMGIWE